MNRRRLATKSSVSIAALSSSVKRYAAMPYSPGTALQRDYHFRQYNGWCVEQSIAPYPLDVDQLMQFAAARARTYAFHTVREGVRLIAMEYRKTSGIDLFSDTRLASFFDGLRRMRPPRPVLPLKPADFERIVAHRGRTWKMRRSRAMVMLCWAAGFTTIELRLLDAEMITFEARGASVRFGDVPKVRSEIFIGRAADPERCPVAALEGLIAERGLERGPVFHCTPEGKPRDYKRLKDSRIYDAMRIYGKEVGTGRLSVERIRRGGMIVQAEHVDIVTLSHYHGLRSVKSLADFLDVHIEERRRYRSRSRS